MNLQNFSKSYINPKVEIVFHCKLGITLRTTFYGIGKMCNHTEPSRADKLSLALNNAYDLSPALITG